MVRWGTEEREHALNRSIKQAGEWKRSKNRAELQDKGRCYYVLGGKCQNWQFLGVKGGLRGRLTEPRHIFLWESGMKYGTNAKMQSFNFHYLWEN